MESVSIGPTFPSATLSLISKANRERFSPFKVVSPFKEVPLRVNAGYFGETLGFNLSPINSTLSRGTAPKEIGNATGVDCSECPMMELFESSFNMKPLLPCADSDALPLPESSQPGPRDITILDENIIDFYLDGDISEMTPLPHEHL